MSRPHILFWGHEPRPVTGWTNPERVGAYMDSTAKAQGLRWRVPDEPARPAIHRTRLHRPRRPCLARGITDLEYSRSPGSLPEPCSGARGRRYSGDGFTHSDQLSGARGLAGSAAVSDPSMGMPVIPVLLRGGRLEFDHQLGGHPSAVFYLDALGLGPLTDLGGVQPARRSPAPASCRPTNTAAPAARRSHNAPARPAEPWRDPRSGRSHTPHRPARNGRSLRRHCRQGHR